MGEAARAADGTNLEDVAKRFLLLGIQEWGQTEADRAHVTAEYVWEAGFRKIEASGYPIFGGIFPQRPMTGPDGEAATEWLRTTLENLQRGEFYSEVQQLTDALIKRTAETTATT